VTVLEAVERYANGSASEKEVIAAFRFEVLSLIERSPFREFIGQWTVPMRSTRRSRQTFRPSRLKR
jgi:hypothetical protein